MSVLDGIGFERKGSGCIVVDNRGGSKKFVGLIVRRPFTPNFMLCPLVMIGLTFNMTVPKEFKSIHNAEKWLLRHSVMWNEKRRYTVFNFLIGHILADNSVVSPLGNWRFHIIFTHLLMSVMCGFILPASIESFAVSLTSQIIAVGTGGYAIVNLVLFIRERL
ncbi:hypothetical protein F4Y93_06180 [Candidatus Poribacteria bacterium]|nr:hypothetical protein [Candidatus Poribacteria bacterium]